MERRPRRRLPPTPMASRTNVGNRYFVQTFSCPRISMYRERDVQVHHFDRQSPLSLRPSSTVGLAENKIRGSYETAQRTSVETTASRASLEHHLGTDANFVDLLSSQRQTRRHSSNIWSNKPLLSKIRSVSVDRSNQSIYRPLRTSSTADCLQNRTENVLQRVYDSEYNLRTGCVGMGDCFHAHGGKATGIPEFYRSANGSCRCTRPVAKRIDRCGNTISSSNVSEQLKQTSSIQDMPLYSAGEDDSCSDRTNSISSNSRNPIKRKQSVVSVKKTLRMERRGEKMNVFEKLTSSSLQCLMQPGETVSPELSKMPSSSTGPSLSGIHLAAEVDSPFSMTARSTLDDENMNSTGTYPGYVGAVEFTMQYLVISRRFKVTVLSAHDLCSGNGKPEQSVNTYVQACLMPGKLQKQSSQTVKHTRNPRYDFEMFFNDIGMTDLRQMTLRIKVQPKEHRLRPRKCIGEVRQCLREFDLVAQTKLILPLHQLS